MKILILGADGFIGRYVYEMLSEVHETYRGTRRPSVLENDRQIDLTAKDTIIKCVLLLNPDVIINCAGIIDSSKDTSQNVVFTQNILEAIVETNLKIKKVIICGSAGEYGVVANENIPVSEDVPLMATAGYGLDKRTETTVALEYSAAHNLPLVVARIFNPLGPGMNHKLLASRIVEQIRQIKQGERNTIEVSRLASRRDYIDVRDVASALKIIAESNTSYNVYNVGSGVSTSNQDLVKMMLNYSALDFEPELVETSDTDEPLVANQANIHRINSDLGWSPVYNIEQTIKELMNNA